MAGDPTEQSSVSTQIHAFDQRCRHEVDHIRARRLRVMQYGMLGLLAPYLLFTSLSGNWILVLNLSAVALICGLSVYFLKARKNLVAASVLQTVGLFFSIYIGTLVTGGLDSIGVWSLALIPVTSAALFDTRGTTVSLVLTLLALGAIPLLDQSETFATQTFGTSLNEAVILCAINIGVFSLVAHMVSSNFTLSVDQIEEQRSQLDAAHQQAKTSNQAKAKFLARMSHELRTPMNGLLGVTQHLREAKLDDKDHQAVDIIHRCSENLLTMLNDALDRSKVESSRLEFSHGPVNVALLLSDIASLFLAKAKLDGIKVKLDVQEQSFWVLTDATRVRQVISNLVGNALRYSDDGEILISLRVNDHNEDPTLDPTFSICVQDQGIGMDKVQLSRLFQEFEQVHATQEYMRGGTGLGLAISKRLVEGLNGRIEVESTPNQGSKFSVHLPMLRIAPPVCFDVERAKEKRPQLLKGRHVLLVDDGEINLKVAALSLKQLGVQCDMARDGAQAVKRVQENRYDAVFMDIRMPVMDGLEATREIRRQESRGTHIPIIALTAHAYPEDERAALDAGMDAYISKPFKRAELESVLYELLVEESALLSLEAA